MNDEQLDLETFLPYRLNRLAEAVSRDFSRIYKERFGMTRPEWRLLATLGQYGAMTATGIGAHSAMHKTKVSRAVSALEKRRWLAREVDANDRRVEHLSLSKAGLAAYAELVPMAHAFEDSLMAALPAKDRQTMLAGLDVLEALLIG